MEPIIIKNNKLKRLFNKEYKLFDKVDKLEKKRIDVRIEREYLMAELGLSPWPHKNKMYTVQWESKILRFLYKFCNGLIKK